MASKRISQSAIDWLAFADRVPSNQKAMLAAFKVKSDGYLRRMLANPEAVPKIDWAFYTNRVPVAGMVKEFQSQFEALKVPYPADTVSAQVDAQAQAVEREIAEYNAGSNARIAGYDLEVKRLLGLIPYEQMTMEDFRDAFPNEALDPLNKPTFWPHTADEQPGTAPKDTPPAH